MEEKLRHTKEMIKCWYEAWDGKVYVAFSGGKDSTVLLHIARSMFPDIPAVFNNTGLELPEIISFVKTFNNVVFLHPKKTFPEIIEQYGWPVISKEQAQFIWQYYTTKSDKLRNLRWYGRSNGRSKISEKWKFLVNAPFKISHRCCDILKKAPAKIYERRTGRKVMLGMMRGESALRNQIHTCNRYDARRPTSNPLLHWNDADIWNYIHTYNVRYSKIYDLGWERSGCVFCLFGVHRNNPNKFQLLKRTHPKLYDYCINKLGAGKVLDYINVLY